MFGINAEFFISSMVANDRILGTSVQRMCVVTWHLFIIHRIVGTSALPEPAFL